MKLLKKKSISLKGLIAVPGLINAHWHLGESIFRNRLKPGLKIEEYIALTDKINNQQKNIDREKIGLFSLLKSMQSGTTTVAGARCYPTNEKIKVLAVSGFMFMDSDKLRHYLTNFEEKFAKEFNEMDFGLSKPAIFLHSLNHIDKKTLPLIKMLRDKFKVKFFIHLSETQESEAKVVRKFGMSSVKVLDKYGLLTHDSVLVHCVHLSKEDISLIKRKKASVVVCYSSNQNVGDAFIDIKKLVNSVPVAIATDGIASSGSLDLLCEAQKTMNYFNRFQNPCLGAQQVLDMVTVTPAKILGLEKEVGSIEPGKIANIMLINTAPKIDKTNLIWNLLFYYDKFEIHSVINSGKYIIKGGKFTKKYETLFNQSAKYIKDFYAK